MASKNPFGRNKPSKPSKPARPPKPAKPAKPARPSGRSKPPRQKPAKATRKAAKGTTIAVRRHKAHAPDAGPTAPPPANDAESPLAPVAPVDPPVLLRWRRTNSPNGSTRYSQALAAALARAGTNVRHSHPFYAEVRLGRLRVGGRLSLALGARLPRWSRRIVHATQPYDNPPLSAADVVTVHDVMPILRPDLYALGRRGVARRRRQVRRALRRSQVVVVSQHSKDEMAAAFPKLREAIERAVVIPHGLDHAAFHPGPPQQRWLRPLLRTGFLNVACVLNAERRKRIDLLADAAAASPYVNLIHVGSRAAPKVHQEPLRQAQPALRKMAKEGRYHALGPLDDAALRDVLASVDVVVHPSEAEGFGLPPLEALACGAVVFASDIPAHREVLGEAAVYFDLTARSLADAFDAAWTGVTFSDEAFPSREVRLARARSYSWDKAADAHRAIYRGLDKRSPFRRPRPRAG